MKSRGFWGDGWITALALQPPSAARQATLEGLGHNLFLRKPLGPRLSAVGSVTARLWKVPALSGCSVH